VIYKGYFDDTANTDNAWREVEVWNFHFDKGGDIYLKFKDVSQLCRQVCIVIYFFLTINFNTQYKSLSIFLDQSVFLSVLAVSSK
jgi:hypothetical protein